MPRDCTTCEHRFGPKDGGLCNGCFSFARWSPDKHSRGALLELCAETAQRARKLNGDSHQDRKILEEIGEYMTAHFQLMDGRDTEEHEQEEAADVILAMLGKLDEIGWRYLRDKRQRLEARLDKKEREQNA